MDGKQVRSGADKRLERQPWTKPMRTTWYRMNWTTHTVDVGGKEWPSALERRCHTQREAIYLCVLPSFLRRFPEVGYMWP